MLYFLTNRHFFHIFVASINQNPFFIMKVELVLQDLKRRFPNEPEYLQAVQEVLESIEEIYNQHTEFEKAN